MSSMNLTMPEALKTFVDEQTSERGFDTGAEYIRDLIRKDLERQRLRSMLLAGAGSAGGVVADEAFFEDLRERAARTRG